MFSPNQVKIVYGDSTIESVLIENTENEFIGQNIRIILDTADDGSVTPKIYALNDITPSYLQIVFNIPNKMLGDDLYYYYAAYTTNDIVSVFKHTDRPKNDMKDVFLAKNTKDGSNVNIGLLTANRFFAYIHLDNNTVAIQYDLENKDIPRGTELILEKYIYGTQNEFDFLENKYAPLIAKYNQARPLASTPTGWCSWSCYYRNVDDKKISNCIEDMAEIKGTNLFQIDDGWQFDGTFPGEWHIDTEKFPNGLYSLIQKSNDAGMTFGLWLSPFLVSEKSRYYNNVKHLVRTDVIAGNSTPNNIYRIFDLDNPEFYDMLYKTYHWLSYDMGVKYYKLDFLVFGYFSFNAQISFKSDYKSALFRKVIKTIRNAIGEDAIMLSCGSPIIECAGIFDAQRISRDIICRKGPGDPFYWQHWSNIKNASKTVLYRYFYNNVVFRNDPDGVVLRDYDIGDGFDCNYSEAKYWSTIVAFSGGIVLANDEFRDLSKPRKELFTKLIPALGISGRAVDMFEQPAPTKAIIEATDKIKYIASFNISDSFENIDVKLTDFGISGKKLVCNCWDATFTGITEVINEKLVNPHNALMYMVKDIPTEPTFLYSDVNLYLGVNVFESKFENGVLDIRIVESNKDFVTEKTKVFAYYPKQYSDAIGKAHYEIVVKETTEYVITEYKI